MMSVPSHPRWRPDRFRRRGLGLCADSSRNPVLILCLNPFVFCCAVLVLLGAARAAHGGDTGFYVSGKTGVVVLENLEIDSIKEADFGKIEFKNGFGLSGAAGYDFGPVRIEGEFGYRRNELDRFVFQQGRTKADGDVTDIHLMLNGFFDIENRTPFTPYIGGGIGIAYCKVNDAMAGDLELLDEGTAAFAYQLGLGLEYPISESLSVEVGYRYFGTTGQDFTDSVGFEVNSDMENHNVTVGLRYTF